MSGVTKTVQQTARRASALKRLQAQLKLGKKRTKSGELVKLTDKDVNRIEKEINTLKTRI